MFWPAFVRLVLPVCPMLGLLLREEHVPLVLALHQQLPILQRRLGKRPVLVRIERVALVPASLLLARIRLACTVRVVRRRASLPMLHGQPPAAHAGTTIAALARWPLTIYMRRSRETPSKSAYQNFALSAQARARRSGHPGEGVLIEPVCTGCRSCLPGHPEYSELGPHQHRERQAEVH